jgi:hypothetical protein
MRRGDAAHLNLELRVRELRPALTHALAFALLDPEVVLSTDDLERRSRARKLGLGMPSRRSDCCSARFAVVSEPDHGEYGASALAPGEGERKGSR